jgi:hypothetical protein
MKQIYFKTKALHTQRTLKQSFEEKENQRFSKLNKLNQRTK